MIMSVQIEHINTRRNEEYFTKTNFSPDSNREDPDQPAHLRRLVCVFAAHLHNLGTQLNEFINVDTEDRDETVRMLGLIWIFSVRL